MAANPNAPDQLVTLLATVSHWSDQDIAERWVRLYPTGNVVNDQRKIKAILCDVERIKVYRERLSDLSWLMKSICEPIARRANREDEVLGRFWEGRFNCQLLKREIDVLSAMTYVDLNPIRAGMAKSVSASKHTSVKARCKAILKNHQEANQVLAPIVGVKSFNVPRITAKDYIDLVDFTGRQWAKGKRGKIAAQEPKALTKLGLNPEHWTRKVKGIGSGYWRVVGTLEDLREKAKELGKRTMYGVGLAAFLKTL